MKNVLYCCLMIVLGSCHKDSTTIPKSTCSLKLEYNGSEVAIENTDAQWDYKRGTLSLTAEGVDHELLKIHLSAVTDTATITNLDVSNILYADDAGFVTDSCIRAFVRITKSTAFEITGSYSAVLQQRINRTETKSVAGSFTVYNIN